MLTHLQRQRQKQTYSAHPPTLLRLFKASERVSSTFGPDMNLAAYVQQQVDKEIIPVPEGGHCYVHKMFNLGVFGIF